MLQSPGSRAVGERDPPGWGALAHLRRGDDHRPIDVRCGQVLHGREVFVRRPGWGVHNEVVHLAPVHVSEELLDHACKEKPRECLLSPILLTLSTEAQLVTFTYGSPVLSISGVWQRLGTRLLVND